MGTTNWRASERLIPIESGLSLRVEKIDVALGARFWADFAIFLRPTSAERTYFLKQSKSPVIGAVLWLNPNPHCYVSLRSLDQPIQSAPIWAHANHERARPA